MAGTVCSICLDELKEPVSIPCGHIHCQHCLVDYIQRAEDAVNAVCPTCRAPFPLSSPDLRVIPRKYHSYINPSLRRVYIPTDLANTSAVDTLKHQITRLEGIVDALKLDKSRLMGRAEANMASARAVAAKERDARRECERLLNKLQGAKGENDELQRKNIELHAKYSSLKAKYSILKDKQKSLSNAHPAAKRKSDQAFSHSPSPGPSNFPRRCMSTEPDDDTRHILPIPKRPRLFPVHVSPEGFTPRRASTPFIMQSSARAAPKPGTSGSQDYNQWRKPREKLLAELTAGTSRVQYQHAQIDSHKAKPKRSADSYPAGRIRRPVPFPMHLELSITDSPTTRNAARMHPIAEAANLICTARRHSQSHGSTRVRLPSNTDERGFEGDDDSEDGKDVSRRRRMSRSGKARASPSLSYVEPNEASLDDMSMGDPENPNVKDGDDTAIYA